MIYYKIPLTGGLDYPAGCILCCAYTYNGYEYCKFERVTEVSSGWIKITESEFNVRCPEFPAPMDNACVYIDNWDVLDRLLADAVSGMDIHAERLYILNFSMADLHGEARLRIFKGMDDADRENVRVDLYVSDGYTLHRTAVNDGSGALEWDEWEWDNPPMKNTNYRTTERHHGKPVYVKTLSGEVREGGRTSSLLITSDATHDFQIVSISAVIKSQYNFTLPSAVIVNYEHTSDVECQAFVDVYAPAESVGDIATVTVKYTK